MTTTERRAPSDAAAHTPDNSRVTALTGNPSSPNTTRRPSSTAASLLASEPGAASADGDSRQSARRVRPRGVEVRVHGIGDHATYSALGRPKYKELVDSRVWIGEVPHLPAHQLRLVNWSRANRKITRHLSWYLAFPFTLLNVAGYMEPKEAGPRRVMRAGIALASLCLTFSMAAWITVILETAWRRPGTADDRLTAVALDAIGPGLLILFIVYRMFVGRALVDKGGTRTAVASVAMLVLMILYLKGRPASTPGGRWLNRVFAWFGHRDNTIDAMTNMVVGTSVVVWLVALGLCCLALWQKHNGAAFAAAAVLLVSAVTLLHAVGSILRLFTASLFRFQYVADGEAAGNRVDPAAGHVAAPNHVLLPSQDSFGNQAVHADVGPALRIDLIPVFGIAMLVVFAFIFWFELWRQHNRTEPVGLTTKPGRAKQMTKAASRKHELVRSLPDQLASPVAIAILGTGVLWLLMGVAFTKVSASAISETLLALQITGAALVVLIIIQRPDELAERLRRTFGSIADIAGFWAPDLHPLAGASYRRALLSGIRQAINDLAMEYPHDPIALVGHSQGSVVCAWFMRGGHWTERATEGMSDRAALGDNLHELGQRKASERIALFTGGSPLFTLYATFFPRYFDQRFFDSTTAMTFKSSRWRNYWRKTDPIGSPLPIGHNIDVTENIDEETLGHGEYWRNERLRADIDRFFKNAEIKRRVLVDR